jgi:hypothetical protein
MAIAAKFDLQIGQGYDISAFINSDLTPRHVEAVDQTIRYLYATRFLSIEYSAEMTLRIENRRKGTL